MKIDSDVKLELMAVEGESTEGYIARLRDLHAAKSLAHIDAKRALSVARTDLAATSRRGAHAEEYREVHAMVTKASRAVGKARYEMESVEFALSEVFHVVNR